MRKITKEELDKYCYEFNKELESEIIKSLCKIYNLEYYEYRNGILRTRIKRFFIKILSKIKGDKHDVRKRGIRQ